MGATTFSGPVTSTGGFISGTDSITTTTVGTLAVTPAANSGRVNILQRADGIAVTLPAAAGTGNVYDFFVSVTVTSDTTISVASAADTMAGAAIIANDGGGTASIFETTATSDTITFDGTTTGGLLGATVKLRDVAANLWAVEIVTAATGTEATPFSAAVS